MSTQPGKSKGGSGKGSEDKSKKTVAASAKPARDETTVEITPVVSDATTPDLEVVKETDGKPAEDKAIAPVKDTSESAKREAAKREAAKAEPVKKEPVKKDAPGWTKPAEPSGSVSSGRTDKPFGRREVSGSATPGVAGAAAASNSAGASNNAGGGTGNNSGPSGSMGFAGTVLKDRPAAAAGTGPGSAKAPANGKPARKAQLQLARLEPWSVMKFSFVMSLVCFVVLLVAVIVLYMILSGLGVFSAISDTVNELTKRPGQDAGGLDAGNWFSFARVFGYTVLVGALNVLLITALSTVGSVIYNLAADLVGGVEVTLKEAE